MTLAAVVLSVFWLFAVPALCVLGEQYIQATEATGRRTRREWEVFGGPDEPLPVDDDSAADELYDQELDDVDIRAWERELFQR